MSILSQFFTLFFRWEKIIPSHHASSGFFFQSKSGIPGNLPSFLCGDFIFRESYGFHAFGDSTGREFSKGGEEEFFLAHVVSEIVRFCESLEILVVSYLDACPFLVDNIRQYGEFFSLLYSVLAPVVCELVSRFLSGHALLDPFLAAPVFLPEFPRSIEGYLGVIDLL